MGVNLYNENLVKKDIKIRNKQKLLELKNLCLKFFIIYTLNLKKRKNNQNFFLSFFLYKNLIIKIFVNITNQESYVVVFLLGAVEVLFARLVIFLEVL